MNRLAAILTAIVTLTFVVSPALTDPFSGFRADQLPIPQIDPPIQPAGYAFAIWGLIYGWLVVSAGFGLWKRADDTQWTAARWPLIASLAVGTPWLAVANTSAIWATVMIFVMAIAAIWAMMRAPTHDYGWLRAPVAIYAGWLTAASFVSLGSTAAGYGIAADALGWAYAGIVAATLLGGVLIKRSREPAYGLTIIWAFVGIIVANGVAQAGVSAVTTVGIVALAWAISRSLPIGPTVPS